MSDQDAFDRILASLHEATLDDSQWPATSALIDAAIGSQGNTLLVGAGPPDDIRISFVGLYYRGERRPDLEREYLTVYHPLDECVPRFRQLPANQIVHATALYTTQELQTSVAYNDGLRLLHGQNSLKVRLAGPAGSHITWSKGKGPGISRVWHGSGVPRKVRKPGFLSGESSHCRGNSQGLTAFGIATYSSRKGFEPPHSSGIFLAIASFLNVVAFCPILGVGYEAVMMFKRYRDDP